MTTTEYAPSIAVFDEAKEASLVAAQAIAELLRDKPDAVLGLATGSTPIGLYAELVRMHREEGLDFSRATFFNLDEYIGLPPEHVASFRHFMQTHLFDHINANPARIFIPDGMAADPEAECARYEAALQEHGPIDLQILGVGANGHIAFNEPGADLDGLTHCEELTAKTRQDNSRFFEVLADVPTHAITMGVGSILRAQQILLLAFGAAKREAIGRLVSAPISPECPATALRRHSNVTLLIDQEAASLLPEATCG